MTAGYSGSYAIGGSNLTLQPTTGHWVAREEFGTDGAGHTIYGAVRQFELKFDLASMSDFNQFWLFYNAVGVTGTVVVDLPQIDFAGYKFYSYSGCLLKEPDMGEFFEEYPQSITLLVTGIKTP